MPFRPSSVRRRRPSTFEHNGYLLKNCPITFVLIKHVAALGHYLTTQEGWMPLNHPKAHFRPVLGLFWPNLDIVAVYSKTV